MTSGGNNFDNFFRGGISNFFGGKFPPQRCLE